MWSMRRNRTRCLADFLGSDEEEESVESGRYQGDANRFPLIPSAVNARNSLTM